MSIEAQETLPGPQAEVAVQVGKASPRNRSRTRRAIMVGGAIFLSAGFAFLVYSGIQSRIDAEKGLENNGISISALTLSEDSFWLRSRHPSWISNWSKPRTN